LGGWGGFVLGGGGGGGWGWWVGGGGGKQGILALGFFRLGGNEDSLLPSIVNHVEKGGTKLGKKGVTESCLFIRHQWRNSMDKGVGEI